MLKIKDLGKIYLDIQVEQFIILSLKFLLVLKDFYPFSFLMKRQFIKQIIYTYKNIFKSNNN